MKICLLGAPGTGKTQLAGELAPHFSAVVDGDLSQAATADAVLVMGLDLPGSAGADAADGRLREQLQQAGIPYRVVYGSGPERLRNALAALGQRLGTEAAPAAWNWACEKCSDPVCEHRLFTGLLQRPDT
jgi:hypothetical protein